MLVILDLCGWRKQGEISESCFRNGVVDVAQERIPNFLIPTGPPICESIKQMRFYDSGATNNGLRIFRSELND